MKSNSRRVVITGIGMITPIGMNARATWNGLLELKSGLKDTSTLPNADEYSDIPSKVVAPIPQLELDEMVNEMFTPRDLRRYSKFVQYALLATREALEDSKIDVKSLSDEQRNMFGVCMGSGIGGWEDTISNTVNWTGVNNQRRKGFNALAPLFIPKILTNMAAGNVSIHNDLRGPNHSVSTACATGNHSIGDAYRFIKDGYADTMVAGATEAAVHPVALGGFSRAKSVVTGRGPSDDVVGASRPFDSQRSGFVLGEGAGVLILEEAQQAIDRGAKIYAEVLGYGLSGDAYHITTPHPDASGALRSMNMALRMANKCPTDIGYINAHATSTLIGDRTENMAIWKLLGQDGIDRGVKVGAYKGHFGHLLGAAGAVETAIGAMCISNEIVAPTKNCVSAGGLEGDECSKWEFDYCGDVKGGRKWREANEGQIALCNSFGFGGTNATICLGKFHD